MVAHGAFGDEYAFCDLSYLQSLTKQADHLELSFRETCNLHSRGIWLPGLRLYDFAHHRTADPDLTTIDFPNCLEKTTRRLICVQNTHRSHADRAKRKVSVSRLSHH